MKSFEDYCIEKYGLILTDNNAVDVFGEEDCAGVGSHSYLEQEKEYDRIYQGFTDEQIFRKQLDRGAQSLIEHTRDMYLEQNKKVIWRML